MPATVLKDHYKTLELHPSASADEVRKAYRALARKYHPDVNADNPYAIDYFREVKEAYEVLREPTMRRRYDEERRLSGMGNRAKDAIKVTPQWILAESRRLSKHMTTVDTYRMSHKSLYDYICLLLADSHMAVLRRDYDEGMNALIVDELLYATKGLEYQYAIPVAELLMEVAKGNDSLYATIQQKLEQRKKKEQLLRLRPMFIAIGVLILCIIMYLWAKK